MKTVIPPVRPAWVAVSGDTAVFPVRRIFCVGRNYPAHTREMGGDERERPFFFTKPADALVADGGTVPYPPATGLLHHEIEMVVAIGTGGAAIAASSARQHVFGYGVGLDLTRRDLQNEAKQRGRPWDMGKAFDHSAPCAALHPADKAGHPERGAIRLAVNGDTRQAGDLGDMIWSVPEIIAHLSALVTLAAGDLVYTGTPAGVGPVGPGDRLHGEISGLGGLDIRIGRCSVS